MAADELLKDQRPHPQAERIYGGSPVRGLRESKFGGALMRLVMEHLVPGALYMGAWQFGQRASAITDPPIQEENAPLPGGNYEVHQAEDEAPGSTLQSSSASMRNIIDAMYSMMPSLEIPMVSGAPVQTCLFQSQDPFLDDDIDWLEKNKTLARGRRDTPHDGDLNAERTLIYINGNWNRLMYTVIRGYIPLASGSTFAPFVNWSAWSNNEKLELRGEYDIKSIRSVVYIAPAMTGTGRSLVEHGLSGVTFRASMLSTEYEVRFYRPDDYYAPSKTVWFYGSRSTILALQAEVTRILGESRGAETVFQLQSRNRLAPAYELEGQKHLVFPALLSGFNVGRNDELVIASQYSDIRGDGYIVKFHRNAHIPTGPCVLT